MFSRACEYAIKAMIYIEFESQHNQNNIKLNDIAEAIDSPMAFTAKILQKLRKHQLLESSVGAKGGFQHATGKEISLRDIIVAIDGEGIFKNCVLGLKQCSAEYPCPMHDEYARIRGEMEKTMHSSKLKDVAQKLLTKKIALK